MVPMASDAGRRTRFVLGHVPDELSRQCHGFKTVNKRFFYGHNYSGDRESDTFPYS